MGDIDIVNPKISTLNINGNVFDVKDAEAQEILEEIITAISENNGSIGSRINDLNSRLTTIEGTQYENVQADWNALDGAQAILNKPTIPSTVISNGYQTVNEISLPLEIGDTYEEAFSKLESTMNANDLNKYNIKDGKLISKIKIDNIWYDNTKDYYAKQYFTIVSLEDNNIIKFTVNNDQALRTISISLDNGLTWVEKTSSVSGTTLATLLSGQKMLIKGYNSTYATISSNTYYNYFSSTENYEVYGNIMSLIYGDNFVGATTLSDAYNFYFLFKENTTLIDASNLILPTTILTNFCYSYMFYNCSSLTAAPELPATTLASYCYQYMLYGCRSLTAAPELPATTLAEGCYAFMFGVCTSLTKTPELPAMTLVNYCYYNMFNNCRSLTAAPELLATTLAQYCYCSMFNNCTSLTAAPELPATILASNCYSSMFAGCTALTTAPELPAKTLTTFSCYSSMFSGCTALTKAPELPAITLASYCYQYMFNNCTSLTTAPELPAKTLPQGCYSYMFIGCTSLTTAPELPATTLAQDCYDHMFYGCTRLNKIICLATNISASNCVRSWLTNVSSNGIFVKVNSMSNWTTGTSGIPDKWNIYSESEYTIVRNYKLDYTLNKVYSKLTAKRISTIPINLNFEKINTNQIYKVIIPIDSSKNIYNGDNISNSIIIPYISNNENYLLLQLGNIIVNTDIILEANLIGNGIFSNTNILYNDNNMQIYSQLPLNLIKDNIEYLIVTYYHNVNNNSNSNYLYLWFDDYPDDIIDDIIGEAGAYNWEDYVDNYLLNTANNRSELYNGANCYQYTGETFEWNDNEYYLWKGSDNIAKVNYILTETIDYNELYSHSLEADSLNAWCPYIIKFDPDYMEDAYDNTKGDILVTVSNSPQDMWVKYINNEGEGPYDDWGDYVENYLLNSNGWIGAGQEYYYTGETFEWEGVEYYLWVENISNSYYILTDTIDYQTLYDKSIEANYYNTNCPYVAKLDVDQEFYDLPNLDKWLVKVIPNNSNNTQAQYIYIDNFNIITKI